VDFLFAGFKCGGSWEEEEPQEAMMGEGGAAAAVRTQKAIECFTSSH